jgi:hypothetical protein
VKVLLIQQWKPESCNQVLVGVFEHHCAISWYLLLRNMDDTQMAVEAFLANTACSVSSDVQMRM